MIVVVSLDTEEDNWTPARHGVTTENLRELPRLARALARLGARPTYFTTYQVAIAPRAADALRDACALGAAEIGAHLHPWNTPPLDEPVTPRNSMLNNLPDALQLAKLERLTAALRAAFGRAPDVFRAGRYGLGPGTVAALARCDYRVDSSVSPFTDLRTMDEGPDFVGAPLAPYWLAPGRDVRTPAPDGAVLEIPVSAAPSRRPFPFWHGVRRALAARPRLHLAGIASRLGLVRNLTLSPETTSVRDMLTLSRRLIEAGVPQLQLTWHSPTLMPALGPFAATGADVERLYARVARYLEGLARLTPVTFATVGEAAAALASLALGSCGARATPPGAIAAGR